MSKKIHTIKQTYIFFICLFVREYKYAVIRPALIVHMVHPNCLIFVVLGDEVGGVGGKRFKHLR